MQTPYPHDLPLRFAYRALAASFLVVGLIFFLFPDGTIDALNWVGALFGFPPAPHLAHRFWLGLGVAYMAVVTWLAFAISEAPTERRLLMPPLALGKAVSSGTCLLFLLVEHAYCIYLANFLVDGAIAAFVVWTWKVTDPDRLACATGVAPSTPGLGDRSRVTLRAIADAFLPAGGAFDEGADAIALAERVETYFARMGPFGLPLASLLLAWMDAQSLLFHLRPTRLHRLDLDQRVRLLEEMEESRLMIRRQPVVMLKLLLGLHAYREPAIARAIGYGHDYLESKLQAAEARRRAGGKGPYPVPERQPAMEAR